MQRFFFFLIVISMIVPPPVLACLWDSETLAMERQRFPKALELIMGMFVRHSQSYYEWRVDKISGMQKEDRSLIDYDDLAVAFDKLGHQEKAISTILVKMERWPDQGRYESEANLGTFYIHSGQFEKGLVHINKAIEINPDAHFGREVYQKLLVEYVIERRATGATLPLNQLASSDERGFAHYVLVSQNITEKAEEYDEIKKAIKGVLGMMRFGHHDSPILLEALGDLFRYGNWDRDALNLANRAYEKAAYEAEEEQVKNAYLKKMQMTPNEHYEKAVDSEFGYKFLKELSLADRYFSKIQQDEKEWADAGLDLDEQFAQKYFKEPVINVRTRSRTSWSNPTDGSNRRFNIANYSDSLLLIILFPALGIIGYILFRNRNKNNVQETRDTD